MSDRPIPSLRIARLVISNFRTFHGPTEIPLSSGGKADAMPVFHGGNGAGKSNAIAAIELFFRGASYWLRNRSRYASDVIPLEWNVVDSATGFAVSPRSWPPRSLKPCVIEAKLKDDSSPFRLVLTPAGNEVFLRLEGVWAPEGVLEPDVKEITGPGTDYLAGIRSRIDAPLGLGSKPLFRFDARRRDFRFVDEGTAATTAPWTPLSPEMTERLHALATSLNPLDTDRWRHFVELLGRFKTLQGREVTIVRTDEGADLRFEIRGRQILRLSELSSGEQQVVAMCAAVLTSRAAIVAIEEPEISLHPDYQELIRDMLLEQVRSGLVDQIILESHVPTFDGPEVLRFSRSEEGATSVTRGASNANDEVRERARKSGATEEWVTSDGYTRLPKEMRDDLSLQAGGYVWFLRPSPERKWEAWTADQLDEMFGWKDRTSEE